VEQNISIDSPVDGVIIPKNRIKDEIFEKEYFGRGVSIRPTGEKIVSPVTGVIESISKERHSVVIKMDCGAKVWIYIGQDVVQLNGEYIEAFVKENQRIEKGMVLLNCNFNEMENLGYNIEVSVCLMDLDNYYEILVHQDGRIKSEEQMIGVLYHPNREEVYGCL
jgi:PTS system beta-glucosides-specific IIC component